MRNLQNLIERINNFDNDYNVTASGSQWSRLNNESKAIKAELDQLTSSELTEMKPQIKEYALSVRGAFASCFENLPEPQPTKAVVSRSKVFKTAWAIFKADLAESFSVALVKAWKLCKIALGYGETVTYTKSTGELREAIALQVGSFETISKGFVRYLENINGSTQWRSFRVDRMVAA